jgi:hypothetical protein
VPSAQPLVFVVGMMRSGTSAVTGSLVELGLETDREDDANYYNEKGYFESTTLSNYAVMLLYRLGGTWYAPPEFDASYLSSPEGQAAVAVARVGLDSVLPDAPAVWKDPQSTLVFPLWLAAAEGRPSGALLVWRDPMEVALSLWRTVRVDPELAMAVWAEHNRRALDFTQGMPVVVCSYQRALAEPERFVANAEKLLKWLGVANLVDEDRRLRAASFFESELRRQSAFPADHPLFDRARQLQPLVDNLDALEGFHSSFRPLDIPSLPAWAESWIRSMREIESNARAERDRLCSVLGSPVPSVIDDVSAKPESLREYAIFSKLWPLKRSLQEQSVQGPSGKIPVEANPAPAISIVAPVWRPYGRHFQRFLASAIGQTWPKTEVCLCDDSSGDVTTELKMQVAASTGRVRIATQPSSGGLTDAARTAYGLATGEFVAFVHPCDVLRADALERVAEAVASFPDVDVVYTDEDKADVNGAMFGPDLKPDWSPELLLAEPYMGHLLVVRRSLLDAVGGIGDRYPYDDGYDIMLRATERARRVVHVRDVLYHWTWSSIPDISEPARSPWNHDAVRASLEEAIQRRGIQGEIRPGPISCTFHLRRPAPPSTRMTSIVVPHRHASGTVAGVATALRRCVSKVLQSSPEPGPVVVAVTEDLGEEVDRLLDRLSGRSGVHVVKAVDADEAAQGDSKSGSDAYEAAQGDSKNARSPWEAFYRAANLAATRVDAEYLCFLHADASPADGWPEALLEQVARPEVGAVGCAFVRPGGGVSHNGIALARGRARWVAGAANARMPMALRWALLVHECTAVSSGCLVTPTKTFEDHGGFDLSMGGFADVDYCMRLASSGLSTVVTPLAVVVHSGVDSEGLDDPTVSFSGGIDRYVHPGLDIDEPRLDVLKSPEKLGFRLEENETGELVAYPEPGEQDINEASSPVGQARSEIGT